MTQPLLKIMNAAQVLLRRREPVDPETLRQARVMLDDIALRGEAAVLEYARRFGDLDSEAPAGGPLEREHLQRALDRLPARDRSVLERTADRIRDFADAQRRSLHDLTIAIPGGSAGHTLVPVSAAGCYAPGGRYPLPSSVLMTAVTARSAGVSRVWVASPRPTEATLAAAAIAGADGLLPIGGVQAIAALADGLLGAPACDVIVGPGNRWVTAAKQLVSAYVGIDMLAGPSELVICADDSADPEILAADLLAQAEHDDDAVPILVSTSDRLIHKVGEALHRQLATLPTGATAARALANGAAIPAADLDEAVRICDSLAPEHLEIITRDAALVARRITSAGAIFIGPASAEVLGDYGAGPNHVLPTGRSARFRAGLSVFTFLRARTFLLVDSPDRAGTLYTDAADLARIEGLEAHARAAELRIGGVRPDGSPRPGAIR